MRLAGTIETGRVGNAIVVPYEAVFPTAEGPVAFRKTGVGFEQVRLQIGKRNSKDVEVLSGLSAGDRVARSNLAAKAERS